MPAPAAVALLALLKRKAAIQAALAISAAALDQVTGNKKEFSFEDTIKEVALSSLIGAAGSEAIAATKLVPKGYGFLGDLTAGVAASAITGLTFGSSPGHEATGAFISLADRGIDAAAGGIDKAATALAAARPTESPDRLQYRLEKFVLDQQDLSPQVRARKEAELRNSHPLLVFTPDGHPARAITVKKSEPPHPGVVRSKNYKKVTTTKVKVTKKTKRRYNRNAKGQFSKRRYSRNKKGQFKARQYNRDSKGRFT